MTKTHNARSPDLKGADHLVWDLPLRLFHWMLVICVFGAIGSAKAEVLEVHQHFGMAVMGLICFRLIWGIAGSQTARFSQFVRPPSEALAVISQIFRGEADKRAGQFCPWRLCGDFAVADLSGDEPVWCLFNR